MEHISETSWPRHKVSQVETRKRDLVLRITDWTRDRSEPAYDVECYIKGVYDWNESEVFSIHRYGTKAAAKAAAIAYAQEQTAKLL